MKPRYSHLVIVLMLLVVTAAGCPGGGGGSIQHAPSLSGLYLYPNSAVQYAGNGTIQVNYIFDFTDAGGDLISMTATVYDGNGTVLDSGTDQFQGASGITEGYVSGEFSADTTYAGTYKIEFTVTDSAGSESNKIACTFTVFPLDSITVTPTKQIIAEGTTQQFTATAAFADNTILDVTAQVAWTSSDTSVATIDPAGLVTGKAAGSSTITATGSDISGTTALKVVPGFASGVNYPVSVPSYRVWGLGDTAIGDLNGDGMNDVAVLEDLSATIPHIFLYFQNADHTLSAPQVITADLNLTGIAIADMNNDGLADLIVSGNSKAPSQPLGRIYVYRQDSTTHTLGTPQQYTLSTDNVRALAVADLNNDGLSDIATSGTGTGGNGVASFLFQSGSGTLGPGPEVTYSSVPYFPYFGGELHVADMNNDGLNDVVLQSGPKQLAVIKQVSTGQFSTTPDYYAIQTAYSTDFQSFALGDLNGDGLTDIVVAELGNNGYLTNFLQDANGQLTGPTLQIVSSNGQDEVDIADMDGDGLNDIISLSNGNMVRILYQTADHAFSNHITYELPTYSSGGTVVHQALSVGDVTGDGLPDFVASWSDQGIFVLPRLP
jgi:hypothetical protein